MFDGLVIIPIIQVTTTTTSFTLLMCLYSHTLLICLTPLMFDGLVIIPIIQVTTTTTSFTLLMRL